MANISDVESRREGVTNEPLARILDLIIRGRARTRPALIEQTGLGRTVVVQRVEQALELGLIEDTGSVASRVGRAPRKLSFRAGVGRILVSVYGARRVELGITDLMGNVLASQAEEWDISLGPERSMQFTSERFDEMIAELGREVPIWAAAIGVPGPVEFASGRPVAPPIMPGWDGYDIRGWVEDRYGLPVWVDNDANLMAMGEYLHGDHDAEDLLFVKVGTGIGAGIIAGGEIQRGSNGAAGDIGHIATAGSEIPCRCGQLGCLEATAGGWALVRDAEVEAREGASKWLAERLEHRGGVLHLDDIVEGVRGGDPICVQLVTGSARAVGESLATVVNVVNPAVVAIGGSLGRTGDTFLAPAREHVFRRTAPLASRSLRVVASSLGQRQGIIGGASLASTRLLRPKSLERWAASGMPSALHHRHLYDLSEV